MIRIKLVLICCLLGITGLRAQAPVPDFTASIVSGCGPLSVHFTDQSSGKPQSWTWDFGNGQISSAQNPYVTYSAAGTYTVTLIVKNSSGANSIVKTDYITVFPYPSPNFISNLQTACAPANVQFTDRSTPGQGSIVQWNWDFGDGGSSTAQNPSHVYTQTGYYDVTLTVVNSGGCPRTTILYRYIRVVAGVTPDFDWSQTSASCSAPFNINFINQTSGPGNLTYSWDLGNSTTSTQKNPSTSYPSNTNYTVNLTATSDLGCSATTSKTISFQGNTPVITAPDNACLNMPVTFQNGSSPAPLASTWDFGDGTTSTFPNPQKAYAAPGTYTVTLTNTYGSCSSSSTKTINVTTALPTQFTADKTYDCKAPSTVNFTDQSTGGTGWLWDFGDGQTSTAQNPSHTYTSMGNFDVSLNVTTNTGCSNNVLTKTGYIRLAPPAVSVKSSSTQGCVGDPIQPQSGIFAPDGVASYLWTAPGATPSTSTAANPTFTYSAQGDYDITFQITTNGGCTASQTFPRIAVIGNKVPAAFTATPLITCARAPVTFTSTSAPVDNWRWDFGDGSTGTVGPTIIHYFVDTVFNDITLTVTNHGCPQSRTEPKYIYVNPPLAGFKYAINCGNRTQVTFTDTSMIDPAKGPYTYQWDFGDGTVVTNPLPPIIHNYALPLQAWNVTLTVSNSTCTDHVTTPVDLRPVIPSFSFPPNKRYCAKSKLLLASTSTPASAIATYSWQIDGGAFSPPSPSPTFGVVIPDTGVHTFILQVVDVSGCPYTSAPVNIRITSPTAKYTAVVDGGCKNSNITFTDNSIPFNSGDPLDSWTLTFGDGQVQTFKTPPFTHQYTDTGTYNVIYTVKDIQGCVDTADAPATVRITSSTAGFFARDTLYCPGAPLPFTDTSKGNNLTYSWDFGDGSAAPSAPGSTDQNPTHPYANNGQYYSVKLKVTDGAGCSDSVTHNNYIHIQKPIASFTLQDSTGICVPLQASFIPAGKYYDSLYWDFGDGQTSTLDTTTHFYNNYGLAGNNYAYTARLILQGAGGCRDTASRNVYVFVPNSTSTLTFSPVRGCDSVTADFIASPTPYTTFSIFFGDGAADSSGNTTPSHTYSLLGTFTPQLSLQDASGCIVGRNNGSITVLGAVPIFSTNYKAFCDTGTVFFQGIVISNDGQTSLAWDFGDGTPPITETTPPGSPSDPFLSQFHFYDQPGVRLASLKVSTNSGCNETYTDTIHVWQTPHPLISMDGPLCAGLIQFHGNVTTPNIDSVGYDWTFSSGSSSGSKDPYLQFPSGPLTAHLKTSVNFGCNDTTSQSVTVFPLPEIKGPKVISTPVGIPVTLPFSYSSNVNTWTWSPSTYLDCTDCPNPVSTPIFNTAYTITVKDENNCVAMDTVLVKTICGGDNYFIPNTFSPNNDGVNDVFYPRGRGLHDIQSMRIFNRWGQLVFEKKNFPANSESQGWDGTINGKLAPSDAYVYIIEVICINAQVIALKGNVTLIR